MMDPSTIKAIAREAAQTAAAEGFVPFIYWNAEEVDTFNSFPFPFLGDYIPEGWVKVDEHFVDASGWGADFEPALSTSQFITLIQERIAAAPLGKVGWAITQAGQFQVYVGEYYQT